MSAINLYVAVDWQGDREIERAEGRLQRETGSAEGVRVRGTRRRRKREIRSCGGRNGKKDRNRQYKRRKEKKKEEKREKENIHKRPRRFY